MAFALTRAQRQQLSDYQRQLVAKHAEIDAAFTDLRAEIDALTHPINRLIDDYNALQRAMDTFAKDVAETFRDEWENRSERWQNSETGTAASDFIAAWDAVDFADVDHVEIVEPDPPDMESLDEVQQLPEDAQ